MSILLRLTTRGLGGPASGLVTAGFGPVVEEVVRIIRGGRSAASRAIKDLIHDIKVSAMLVESNGKEFSKPIINKVRKLFSDEDEITITLTPKKLIVRKSENINISIENIKVRNKNGRD